MWGDDDISNEIESMLIKVEWIKDFIERNTPVLPSSGWMGDNFLKKSGNMAWWKGKKVFVDAEEFHRSRAWLTFVPDARSRALCSLQLLWMLRSSMSTLTCRALGICKIKGVADMLAGRWSRAS